MSNGDNGKRFSERFISFDYAEMKDLLKAFVTLATTVLAFSVTFSEKIVNFQAADLPPKLVLLASWVLLFASVIVVFANALFASEPDRQLLSITAIRLRRHTPDGAHVALMRYHALENACCIYPNGAGKFIMQASAELLRLRRKARPRMSGIFISYRRDDTEGQAGRLFEGLKAQFGQNRVFIDVAGIEPGHDFRHIIDEHVSSCDVLLALVGRNWLHIVDKKGRRRLDSPDDFVRLEIATALRRDIAVIPVLVQGAAMPSKEELPADLQALAWRNAVELRHTRWDADFAELAATLQNHSGYIGPSQDHSPKRPLRWRWSVLAVISLAVIAIAITAVLRPEDGEVAKQFGARNPSPPGAAAKVQAAPVPTIRLDGRWKGTVTYDWGPTVDETFDLRFVGGTASGSAGFLGQARTILKGSLDGSSIRFVTKRLVTVGGDQREAVNHYAGTIEGDKIDMVLSIEDATSSHEPAMFTLSRVD